jgi:hypothetical protein
VRLRFHLWFLVRAIDAQRCRLLLVELRIAKLNQVRACLHHLRTHGLEILWSRWLQPKHQAAAIHVPLQLLGLFRTDPAAKGMRKVPRTAR